MSDHTKGPWRYTRGETETGAYKYDGWGYIRDNPTNKIVAVCGLYAIDPDADLDAHRRNGTDPSEANAERIVSCVNALEGIENPEAIKEVIEIFPSLIIFSDLVIEHFGGNHESNALRAKAALAKLKAAE